MNGTTNTVTLDDLCDLVNVQVAPEMHENVTYIGLDHVAPGNFFRIGQGTAFDVQSSKFAFKCGDVLYGKLRPYLDKAILADIDGICTTELLVLRPKQGVDPRFLLSVVHAPNFIDHAMSGVTGVQHPRTSWHRIKEFELPNFNDVEQKNIANLLLVIQKTMFACEHLIKSAGDVKRATMRELFTRGLRGEAQKETEIGLVPESWTLKPFEKVANIFNGFAFKSSDAVSTSRTQLLRMGNLYQNQLSLDRSPVFYPDSFLEEYSRFVLTSGDMVMSLTGTMGKEDYGYTVRIPDGLNIKLLLNQRVAKINVHTSNINKEFLFHYLLSRQFLDRLYPTAKGTKQGNLSSAIIHSLLIAAPNDFDEQREIAEILDAIDRKIDLHKRKKTVLEELFKSLLHKLMIGEISVADLDLSVLQNTTTTVKEAS